MNLTAFAHQWRVVVWALGLCFMLGEVRQVGAAGTGDNRTTVLVPVSSEPSWQDMVYLAAVPAGIAANSGTPSVIALPETGEVGRETVDYLKRYKPTRVVSLSLGKLAGAKQPGDIKGTWREVTAKTLDAAVGELVRVGWTSNKVVVLCPENDYSTALTAASLAGRLSAPLMYVGGQGLPKVVQSELRRLGSTEAILVGSAPKAAVELSKQDVKVTSLADAEAVLAWVRKRGHSIAYMAAVNPNDRVKGGVKKLSLAGALLAAARDGIAVPLDYDIEWKLPFTGSPLTNAAPKGIPTPNEERKKTCRKGVIQLDGHDYPFVATGSFKARPHRLFVDLNGDGNFEGKGEGPLQNGGRVKLAGKEYVVTLGRSSGAGKALVRLTHPRPETIRDRLKGYYEFAGGYPEHLCLVGFPDVIPLALLQREPGPHGDVVSDLPYGDVDDDPFVEIAVARLIAEDAPLATLYASRVLTYEDLLDASWQDSIGQARWENTYWPLFENVGFKEVFRHDMKDLPWSLPPHLAPEGKGKRAIEIGDDSPLTHVAAIAHMAHSWWKGLGQTYSMNSTVLLAPTLVDSGGCLTAAIDRDPDYRSVIARLLRNGAVGFSGNARPGTANQEQQRHEFWNSVLGGNTIGQAHRDAQNSMVVTALDTGQMKSGNHHYSLHIRMLFGDPAFKMRVPGTFQSAPARVTAEGDAVTVYGPEKWTPVRIRVPEDWKQWNDKDLYVCRAPGTYADRRWCPEQYDREITYRNAELTTDKHVKSIGQVQDLTAPLGWDKKYWVDEHPDGTRTYRWRVQLIDFDQAKGQILSKVERVDYRITWQGE